MPPRLARAVRVWDLPIRLFHWSLVALLGFSWWSAENHEMDWHRLSGLTILGLIVFRLLWGVIGSSTARFSSFVRSPGTVLEYLRRPAGPARPGHNPVGGYSVLAMLGLLLAQVGAGVFAVDTDGLESGPLSFLVSFDAGRLAAELHEALFNIALAVLALHIAAILFYRVIRRRNLIVPMLTGKDTEIHPTEPDIVPAGPLRFLLAAAIAAAISWWTSNGLGL